MGYLARFLKNYFFKMAGFKNSERLGARRSQLGRLSWQTLRVFKTPNFENSKISEILTRARKQAFYAQFFALRARLFFL